MKLPLQKALIAGSIGGIAGGIAFGIVMQLMGKMPMIASMASSESLAVGWVIHLLISVIFGVSFGGFAIIVKNIWLLTVIFTIGIWILGPLVVMPLMMGMGTNIVNAFTPDQLMNLMTHLFFSVVVAIVYKFTVSESKEKTVSA
ncbi:hypothetical protein [Cytobacillus sp. IB215316]|uniref:hypothetical protein n=1 Tax=Cytobacillus sp. IB215316 TaxID=3097354 RepID=UPI002A16F860|nr:hypothetical protein [Cytobacillus sp. IB215316]MDX8363238.1 hypothetical protein [Cytobacillus sp. IB215316]